MQLCVILHDSMITRLPFVSALLLFLPPMLCAQDSSLEQLRAVLAERSAAGVAAAESAWEKHGSDFLKTGDRNLMAQLEGFKPEIQSPLFTELSRRLKSRQNLHEVPRIMQLLKAVLDQSSSARLLTLVPQLPETDIPQAVYSIIKHGAPSTQLHAQSMLASAKPRLLQSIVEATVLYANESFIPKMFQLIDYETFNLSELGAIFGILAERDFNQDFSFPESVYLISNTEFRIGLLELLAAYPNSLAAIYLIKESIEDALEPTSREIKIAALLAFEAGAKQFKWSRHQNKLQRFLKAEPQHRLATDIAHTLHRLGDKKGTNHLLSRPERDHRDNDGSWPYAVKLGTLQVELGLHSDAYKVFHGSYTKGIKNEQVRRRMKRQDFIWAARAAAGAKRPSVAYDWLSQSGLSMEELHDVADFPEFAPYLEREQFILLFSLDN